jgi:hypothetical protein
MLAVDKKATTPGLRIDHSTRERHRRSSSTARSPHPQPLEENRKVVAGSTANSLLSAIA